MKVSERRAIAAVLELALPRTPARILAHVIAEGEAASQARLAKDLGLSEGKVSQAVGWLHEEGFVRLEATTRPEGGKGPTKVSLRPEAAYRLGRALGPFEAGLARLGKLLMEAQP